MFTVKLMRKQTDFSEGPCKESEMGMFSTKIVEGVEVNIFVLRPRELKEVCVLGERDGNSIAFLIADPSKPKPSGFAPEEDFWSIAFIENSVGATTEVVKAI